jgi:hypothetical protein
MWMYNVNRTNSTSVQCDIQIRNSKCITNHDIGNKSDDFCFDSTRVHLYDWIIVPFLKITPTFSTENFSGHGNRRDTCYYFVHIKVMPTLKLCNIKLIINFIGYSEKYQEIELPPIPHHFILPNIL